MPVYFYAICIVSGVVLSLILAYIFDKNRYNIKFEDVIELLLFILPIGVICARLYFVIFKFDYYIANPVEIFNIRNGGLAIYGGIIGAIITLIVYCKKKKIKILDMLDLLTPYLALGQAIGRWGNFFNLEAHGTLTNNIFRMGIIENGKYIQVHPTFLYESICTLLIFIILYIIRNKRKFSGEIIFLYLSMYGIIRAIIEGLRTDSLMIGNFRISQILSIVLSIVFGILLIYNLINKRSNK